MSRTETVTLTNMCMICDGSRVMVQNRTDESWPGIAFPGGHVEKMNRLPMRSFEKSLKKPA